MKFKRNWNSFRYNGTSIYPIFFNHGAMYVSEDIGYRRMSENL